MAENKRKGKVLWGFWINKTEEKLINDAVEDDEIIKVLAVLDSVIKRGDLIKR